MMFVTWAWPTHFFPLAQLAWAARAEGHEVVVAAPPELSPTITAAGLPAAPVGAGLDIRPLAGRFFASLVERATPLEWSEMRAWGPGNLATYRKIAAAMLDDTVAYARAYRPDVVVHDPTSFAGPIAAADTGALPVRHIWGADYTIRTREFEAAALEPLCERLGLPGVDSVGAVTVDPCPPGMQVPAPVRRLPVRYAPYNGSAEVPRWLVELTGRPRVCVLGSTAVAYFTDRHVSPLPVVTRALAGTGVEILAIGAERDRGTLDAGADQVRHVPATALHLVLPHCDLLVHQGGGGAMMTALAAGIPQVTLPLFTDHVFNSRRLAAAGAGRWIFANTADVTRVRRELLDVLHTPGYRAAARALGAEMAAQPAAAEVVARLAELSTSPERI
ncbi:nucleotide disphospho-sugar-binding domain-containing protein [Actinoplanes sp. TFC3]|uniref:nucleotide disphospho-sugar-binding domain-containing protein n=1 Tax=Actinoplanes sp. TFC3 TaxID=1710355 RepID=UPI0009EA743D|nr:nucleotide disphospho-sugar-binding domain-containing protein [Actinoplanes sp. TFC3]